MKEQVDILFTDENGTHVLTEASGAQGNLLGLTLRAGIARMESEAIGRRPLFGMIDEGMGALDPEMRGLAQNLLLRMSEPEYYGQLLYTTHIVEVQAAARTLLRVEPGPEGSTLHQS